MSPSKGTRKLMVNRDEILGIIMLSLKLRSMYAFKISQGVEKAALHINEKIVEQFGESGNKKMTIKRLLNFIDEPHIFTYGTMSMFAKFITKEHDNFKTYKDQNSEAFEREILKEITKTQLDTILKTISKKAKEKNNKSRTTSISKKKELSSNEIDQVDFEALINQQVQNLDTFRDSSEYILNRLIELYSSLKRINPIYGSEKLKKPFFEILNRLTQIKERTKSLESSFQNIEEVEQLLQSNTHSQLPEDVKLITSYLPTSLFLLYTQSPLFSSIRIPSDINSEIGELPMEDFFISLSYKERDKSAEDEQSLMRKEQSLKYRHATNSIAEDRFNTAEYLSSQVINHYNRLLVHGNAGIGKTTYAKWICNQWAIGKLNFNRMPIFVELKKLDFDSDENSIVAYIHQKYLSTFSKQSIKSTLDLMSNNFKYIFDGFDELNQIEKALFHSDLRGLTIDPKNVSYLVLGRPYGYLNHGFNYSEGIITIDGFNKSSIFRYITLVNNRLKNSQSELLRDIIDDNLILKEYAHTPLILSYIIMIFNFRNEGENILRGIQSIYALHKEVYNWILIYNERNKNIVLPDIKTINKIFEFSKNLILEEKFVFKNEGVVFDEKELLQSISTLGFGSLSEEYNGTIYLFSFTSVTIQEYFAAEGLLNEINGNALAYLAKYSFFWNLVKLIVGGLSYQGKDELIVKTLSHLKADDEWFEIASNKAIYYSMLAESNEKVVNQFLNQESFRDILLLCEEIYFDEDWRNSILNSIIRIIHKSDNRNEGVFKKVIIEFTNTLTNIERTKERGFQRSFVIADFGIYTFLKGSDDFLYTVVEVLVDLNSHYLSLQSNIDNIESDEEYFDQVNQETLDDKLIFETMLVIVRILKFSTSSTLSDQLTEIKGIFNSCTLQLKFDFAFVIANLSEHEDLSLDLQRCTNHLKEISSKNLDDFDFPQTIIDFSAQIYMLSSTFPNLEDSDIKLIYTGIEYYLDLLYHHDGNAFHHERFYYCSEMMVIGLASCENHNFLPLICYIHSETGLKDEIYLQNTSNFTEYLSNLKHKLCSKLDGDDMVKFSWLLRFTIQGINEFHSNIGMCRDIVQSWCDRHSLVLNENDIESIPNQVTDPLDSLFNCASYGYDRRQLLKIAIEFKQYLYIELDIVKNMFQYDFPIHGKDLWDYFLNLTKEDGHEELLLNYLRNDGFFEQVSNLTNIKIVLAYISKKALIDKDFQDTNRTILYTVCSNALILLKRSQSVDPELVELTGKILNLQVTKDLILHHRHIESLKAEYLLGYLLQAHFTQNEEVGITIFLNEYKKYSPPDYQKLIKLIVELFADRQTGIEELEHVASLLDPMLVEDCISYCDNLIRMNELFDRHFFDECMKDEL